MDKIHMYVSSIQKVVSQLPIGAVKGFPLARWRVTSPAVDVYTGMGGWVAYNGVEWM